MLVTEEETGLAAFQHIRDNIEDLNGRVGACDTDLIFLKGLMDSPVMSSLIKVQDRLEESNGAIKPMGSNTSELLLNVRSICRHGDNKVAQELATVLENPHIQALLEAHDLVAIKQYQMPEMSDSPSPEPSPTGTLTGDAVRMVGIRKNDDEPLGITVKNDEENLVIARILAGGIIDRQGLLHVGDIIMEVNGVEVHSPEQLQKQLQRASGSINFKIMSAYQDSIPSSHFYVKTLYSYDPSKDSLLPCKEIGLSFKQGEILQILNQEDPNWWQARKVGSLGLTGLVPSQELEERRRAFVRPEYDYATKSTMCGTKITKKKRKTMYHTKGNAEYDKAELTLYEEVARMPPFERKSIILIGAQGVGRRSLKNRLISSDPSRFAFPLPHTSRPKRDGEQDGKSYFFVSREAIEADIAENRYLEWGEYGGHIYGTKLDSIRAIIRSGKMCIMDCNPQSLKLLKTPEFMPYVIFVSAPHAELLKQMHFYGRNHGYTSTRSLTFDRAMGRHGSRRARTLESLASLYEDEDLKNTIEESSRLQRAYEKYFDLTLVNNNFDKTYEQLREAIDALNTSYQWVPVSWVY
ncbi:MAGUK p55 subfamily member 6-like isoform X2 [Limulus polyphemus]|uniref:MAGUK p55 subfamily member 6-like isoform X2 n=1 Tax=Limulus polyphemus TaxID=6850 RepID=A0ABM1SL63_LIMPO|nr:MAGUK p55 subfamily member 6-like isoform X2 [Limulus polyphemus]